MSTRDIVIATLLAEDNRKVSPDDVDVVLDAVKEKYGIDKNENPKELAAVVVNSIRKPRQCDGCGAEEASQSIDGEILSRFCGQECLVDGRASGSKWIQKIHMKKGAFTAKAKRRGMTPAEYQSEVLAHPDRYDTRTVRQANLRKTLVKF